MGLRHNFAASTDALNYDDEYWNIRATQPTPDDLGVRAQAERVRATRR